MQTIYQKNERDCGVAALAMLARVSHRKAYNFLEREFGRAFTLSSGKIIAGLLEFGRIPQDTKCKKIGDRQLPDLEFDALLGGDCLIPAGEKNWKRSGHWAVWDCEGQCIRDPYGYYYPFQTKKILLVK